MVRVLADAGIMRDEGEGIPRIFEEMQESLLKDPEIEVHDGIFMLRLLNEPSFVGPSAGWKKLVGDLQVSATQRRVLLAHPTGFTNEEYQRLNNVDRDEAYRQIQELVQRGILQKATSAGRRVPYRVTADLHRARSFLDARIPKLREHFRRSPTLTNAQYRDLFGVTRNVAGRDLGQLVDEGFLSREGERRGTHYVPVAVLGIGADE